MTVEPYVRFRDRHKINNEISLTNSSSVGFEGFEVTEAPAPTKVVLHRPRGSQLVLNRVPADEVTHTLHIDFETRSVIDLKADGAHVYAADTTTRMLCVSYAVDAGPFETWLPGMPTPEPILEAARHPAAWLMVAHNAAFERAIWRHVLARHNWPEIPLERWRCSMAQARSMTIPGALEKVGDAINLVNQKDSAGKDFIKRFCVPQNLKAVQEKGAEPVFIEPADDPEGFTAFIEYNRKDVAAERELHHSLPALSEFEQQVWEVSEAANERGMLIDRDLAAAARRVAKAAVAELDAELAEVTDGAVTANTQLPSFKIWLEQQGCKVDGLSKDEVADLLETDLPHPGVRRALEIRVEAGQASPRKIDKMLRWSSVDGRARGTLMYFGAAQTGRWSGAGYQPQNMKNPVILEETSELAPALVAVATGDYELVKSLYHNPIEIVSELLRSMIRAADGCRLISVDYSSIEARMLAALAGEEWKLQEFRNFDADPLPNKHPDKHPEIYKATAARIYRIDTSSVTKTQRKVGKTAELAFGYGGGVVSFRNFYGRESYKAYPEDSTIDEFKTAWRKANSRIVRFWYDLNDAAIEAVKNPGAEIRCRNVSFQVRDEILFLRLPSGRELKYPAPRVEKDKKFNRDGVMYTKYGNKRGTRMYGGKWAAHVTQASARELLAAAMLRLDAAGYKIVLHAHDEIIAEMPDGVGSLDEMKQLMIELPPWEEEIGLPVAAEGWEGQRYRK